METSSKYKVDGDSLSPNHSSLVAKRRLVLSNIYTQTVKDFMVSMICADYGYENHEQLAGIAIGLTDALIEKAGEKL